MNWYISNSFSIFWDRLSLCSLVWPGSHQCRPSWYWSQEILLPHSTGIQCHTNSSNLLSEPEVVSIHPGRKAKCTGLLLRSQWRQVVHLAPSQDDVHVAESADHSLQVIIGSHLTAVIAKDKDHAKLRVIQKTCRSERWDSLKPRAADRLAPECAVQHSSSWFPLIMEYNYIWI